MKPTFSIVFTIVALLVLEETVSYPQPQQPQRPGGILGTFGQWANGATGAASTLADGFFGGASTGFQSFGSALENFLAGALAAYGSFTNGTVNGFQNAIGSAPPPPPSGSGGLTINAGSN